MPQNISIMLVEPDTQSQTKICQILTSEFDVSDPDITHTSQEAMSLIAGKKQYDCVIINSHLRDSSGFSLVSDIKKIEKFSSVSILMMSESKDRDDLLNAAACGASDFIVKPLNTRSFTVKLKKLIGGKRFRKEERVTTFEAFNTDIHFENHGIYRSRLLDISSGGCSVKSELFSRGGCIYDKAKLHIGEEGQQIIIDAELTRAERDPENSDEGAKELLAAFEFRDASPEIQEILHNFIDQFRFNQK